MKEDGHEWVEGELPKMYGSWSYGHISKAIQTLDMVAKKLRNKRFHSGTLRLDQISVKFVLDQETGYPYGYSLYEQKDSNRFLS